MYTRVHTRAVTLGNLGGLLAWRYAMPSQSGVMPAPSLVRRRGLSVRWRTNLAGYGFLAPFFVAYGLFVLWPMINGLRLSFYSWSLLGATHFIGLANYREALHDNAFWTSFGPTLQFAIESTLPLVLLGFAMALLANQRLPGSALLRLAFFYPFMLPATIVANVWGRIYAADYGALNSFLQTLGFPAVHWTSDPGVAMWSVVIMTVWWSVGFNFILYLAGLRQIPQELYDAAMIDGAGPWVILRSITIPLLQRTTILIVILQVVGSLQVFDQIYLLTGDGPEDSTRSIVEYIYETGFQQYRLGYAAAMSYILFIIILVLTIILFVLLRRDRTDS
jgi:ABC-type sugar transport system permease subunit